MADEVRACQSRLGFGDAAAHRMALLAMDQLAWAVAGLRQGFTVGATEAELRDALARGAVAVWAPYASIAGRSDIEESWRLTSDSLALWLGSRLGAARCYLIKSIARPKAPRLSARQLARDGVVDEAFADMLAETGTPTLLLGRGDHEAFAAVFCRRCNVWVRGYFGLTSPRHARPKCRASTNFSLGHQDVDGRDKPGHDTLEGRRTMRSVSPHHA